MVLLARYRYYVQNYYGQEEHQVPLSFSVGGLAGSLPQIFSYLQNLGIPSALSDLILALSPFCPSQKGKNWTLKTKIMRIKRMTIEQGMRVGISRFPNFHKTGSVRGMKKLYYGYKCLLVRCGSYVYNVSAEPQIYHQATF